MRNAISPIKMMIVAVLFSIGLFNTTPASAEWSKFGRDEESRTIYIDFDRIRKNNHFSYYWVLVDCPKKCFGDIGSFMFYFEGDCKIFGRKILAAKFFYGQMGKNPFPSNNKPLPESVREWGFSAPNTFGDGLLQAACSR